MRKVCGMLRKRLRKRIKKHSKKECFRYFASGNSTSEKTSGLHRKLPKGLPENIGTIFTIVSQNCDGRSQFPPMAMLLLSGYSGFPDNHSTELTRNPCKFKYPYLSDCTLFCGDTNRILPCRRNLADIDQSFHEREVFLGRLQIVVQLHPHQQAGIDAQSRLKQ